MTDTPIIDAAIRAAKEVNGGEVSRDYTVASLRAALPWDLPAARLEVMARAWTHPYEPVQSEYVDVVTIYHADPIIRELWPEKFT